MSTTTALASQGSSFCRSQPASWANRPGLAAGPLGVVPLAEGIECEQEGTICREMGFALAQGYYYGRPAPIPAYTLPDASEPAMWNGFLCASIGEIGVPSAAHAPL